MISPERNRVITLKYIIVKYVLVGEKKSSGFYELEQILIWEMTIRAQNNENGCVLKCMKENYLLLLEM